ncbi:MAG: hypothetical protein PHE25_01910 [Candidatus Gracilibacteria bacterium]|nr:hypothetical protein [Candidatus Gracilibacteria bacterium]
MKKNILLIITLFFINNISIGYTHNDLINSIIKKGVKLKEVSQKTQIQVGDISQEVFIVKENGKEKFYYAMGKGLCLDYSKISEFNSYYNDGKEYEGISYKDLNIYYNKNDKGCVYTITFGKQVVFTNEKEAKNYGINKASNKNDINKLINNENKINSKEVINKTFELTDCKIKGEILTSKSKYPGVSIVGKQPIHSACDKNDIIVCTGKKTGYIISACNIGASKSGTGAESYGMYFQWGRNKGFYSSYKDLKAEFIDGKLGLNADADIYPLIGGESFYEYNWNNSYGIHSLSWSYNNIEDNWGYITNNDISKQGPCSTGYHVPTKEEWENVIMFNSWQQNGPDIRDMLKLPFAGYFSRYQGLFYNGPSGITGKYWSNTPFIDDKNDYKFSYLLSIYTSSGTSFLNNSIIERSVKISANTIRCFKNNINNNLKPFSDLINNYFQEYFEVNKNNIFKKFGKFYKLEVKDENKISYNEFIEIEDKFKEEIKNEVIYKRGGEYFYSKGGYYFIKIK